MDFIIILALLMTGRAVAARRRASGGTRAGFPPAEPSKGGVPGPDARWVADGGLGGRDA